MAEETTERPARWRADTREGRGLHDRSSYVPGNGRPCRQSAPIVIRRPLCRPAARKRGDPARQDDNVRPRDDGRRLLLDVRSHPESMGSEKTSGGSSSGTSAALAAGVIPVGVGTDIVGSIRVPASFCGLAGLKPSYGRVPYYPNSSPAAVAGPMARTAADMAMLMQVIAGTDARDFASLSFDRSIEERRRKRHSAACASAL